MEIRFNSKDFDQLTAREFYEIARARTEVFLLEQRIICQDFDRVDYESLHCFLTEGTKVVAYLRAYLADGKIQIGRVLSVTHGIGLGEKLMRESFPILKEKFGDRVFLVHSQRQAEGFYKKLGFVTVSEEFLEENIPHVIMIRED